MNVNTTGQETPIEEAFQAKIIEDSISPYGIRLTTFQLRYPRFIHAEFMTHRQFSRNARSSRAVPVKRLLTEAPYVPHFLKNQKGMQGFEEMDPDCLYMAQRVWCSKAAECRLGAKALGEYLEVHKQWANRMLEWFGYIDVVASSTYWKNFFHLRNHPAAMPEIQHLSKLMHEVMEQSTPRPVWFGDWHLPYLLTAEYGLPLYKKQLISAARCARVSYQPFDGDGSVSTEKDVELANRLIVQDPLHASPAEHQATPDELVLIDNTDSMWATSYKWERPDLHGNFKGWNQFRKMLPNEAVNEDYSTEACLKYYKEHHHDPKEFEQFLATYEDASPQAGTVGKD